MSEAQSLTLESGECVTLSPDSSRFKQAYQQIYPRNADEVRAALGLSDDALESVRKAGICNCASKPPAATVAAEDLDSSDSTARAAALSLTHQAFSSYVYGTNPAVFAPLVPAFNRYLALNKAVINIAVLLDIEVGDGATLTISASTHVVRARKIIIHRTGRIVVRRSTTFKIASLEGLRPRIIGTGPITAAAATLRTMEH
ncbi:MAG TPA: hypothetical protein VM639_21770 [Dongiaceae bacterium]|nr:hypothetical protein [Dongiaceae bacterium]